MQKIGIVSPYENTFKGNKTLNMLDVFEYKKKLNFILHDYHDWRKAANT